MALTEEQLKEIALQVAGVDPEVIVGICWSKKQLVDFAARFLADLPKPKPLFWYRPCCDGEMYEGPIHNAAIEDVCKNSGSWKPLYTEAPLAQPASAPSEQKPVCQVLDAPAMVANVRFGVGVKWSTVILAAQRLHAQEVTPGKEAERIKRFKELIGSLIGNETVKNYKAQRDALLEPLERILENDGADGSKRFDALALYDARVDAISAIASVKGGA